MVDDICPKCGKKDCPCDPETCDCGNVSQKQYNAYYNKHLIQDFEE